LSNVRRAAIELFRAAFATRPAVAASAPGRVNLIGEHTDYNGGPVLPIAIAQRTIVAAGPASDGTLELVSSRTGQVEQLSWREAAPNGWTAYAVGVMREIMAQDGAPREAGARIAVAGDLPVGAGLASSAALTVATGRALSSLFHVALAPRALARVAYRAEHVHAGVRCGVMDPLTIVLARPGRALLLECATLVSRPVPCTAEFLLVDTGVRHDLQQSAFNERRAECEEAVRRLRIELPELMWLARWPVPWIARLKRALPEPLRDRATHVVAESARTRFAAELLEKKQWPAFGRLLFESHESCRELYACSAPELDLVVAAARRAGALGARLTGAGWGGSVLALTKRDRRSRNRVVAAIRRAFQRTFQREPGFIWVTASGGVKMEKV
jgi:galactokinase